MRKNFRTVLLAVLALQILMSPVAAVGKVVEVRLMMSADGTQAYFDPAGIHIQSGDTVRWVQVSNYHSVTAYHPANSNHELRIPENAKSWDSDILLKQYPAQGSTFEHKFTVEGIYDYFCKPHEAAGMVGCIIVGKPDNGPGARPFGYAPEKKWDSIPAMARDKFPSIEEIMRQGVVRATQPGQMKH